MENAGRTLNRAVNTSVRPAVKKASQRLRSGIKAPDFWAFVRALENADLSKPRLGKGKTPRDENVRFGQMPYLHFPPTDIAEIIEGGKAAGVDATIILYFFGLLGINGPMPLEFTNYVFRRSYSYFDNTWRRFLDIIHHRFTTLYYRAFAANQQAISFDRKNDDPFSLIVKSLSGFSAPHELPGKETEDDFKYQESLILKSAQQFSFLAKNRDGLETLLRYLFKFQLSVNDFVQSSYDIPHDSRAVLGMRNNTLGLNLQIGRTYMSITGKFEIHIGPVNFDDYFDFMVSRNGARLLTEAISLFLDRHMDYTVVFTIQLNTIPLAQLGFDLEKARWDAPQLGYTCWIGTAQTRYMTLNITAARLKRKNKRG